MHRKYSSTNRRWQNHLYSKGLIAFFLDRLRSHALSSSWQHAQGAFCFPIVNREKDDALTAAFFDRCEDFPDEFYIELTSHCNLKCLMCARSTMKRKHGFMSQQVFEKIVDEIALKQPLAYIHYYGIGESLLDKMLYKKLAYARSRGLANSVLFTNGQLLAVNANYKKLAESGLASIGVDVDGFSQATYSKIRVQGDFGILMRGIKLLRQYIQKHQIPTRIELAYQVYKGINDNDVVDFIDWCNKQGLEYKLVPMHSWAGLRSDIPQSHKAGIIDQHHLKRVCPCCGLWSGLMIAWDGRVGLCFQDADLREVLGDVKENSIEKIWKTAHFRKRRLHVQGIFNGICKNCDSYTAVALPKIKSKLYPDALRK